ncbi:MAG: ABC transporter substrate-binding protein [Rhodospirillaceae bacterium]|nr:ABC transporter substrate-binding protein [Rhodospirillaceae bacterium]
MIRLFTVIGALSFASLSHACEINRPVIFAGLDWDSVGFHNAVARRILESGYGCKTDAIPGSTIPLLQGVAQGDIDIAMEIWKDAVTDVWQRALKRGQVTEIGVNFPDAVQGWYVPRYMIEGDQARNLAPQTPELKSVSDLARYKEVFADPEEPGKGRFYNCVAGWSCEVINSNKLKAYGLEASFTNFRPGAGTALAAAIAGAYLKREPILAYYWNPTWVLGAYDMVKLQEPAWNEADWKGIAASGDYPRAVDYPKVEVWIGANAAFVKAAPQITAFLAKYRTSSTLVSKALAYMRDNHVSDAVAAEWFLKTEPGVWADWVTPEIAVKIQSSLK